VAENGDMAFKYGTLDMFYKIDRGDKVVSTAKTN